MEEQFWEANNAREGWITYGDDEERWENEWLYDEQLEEKGKETRKNNWIKNRTKEEKGADLRKPEHTLWVMEGQFWEANNVREGWITYGDEEERWENEWGKKENKQWIITRYKWNLI